MNTIAAIEVRSGHREPDDAVCMGTRRSKDLALAGVVKMLAGDLRTLLANLGILAEVADAHSCCRSLAQSQPRARGTQDLMQRIDHMLSAVIQRTRRTGDPLGFRSHLMDLHTVLGLALRLNRPLAESRAVSLRNDGESPVTVIGDRQLLLQLADVLISNAIRRSPESGRVTCLAELQRGSALLHVADEGEALNQMSIARALRPFSTYQHGAGALSLDLWFARLIAERHGGRIVAKTPIGGRGNLFTLSLPVELG